MKDAGRYVNFSDRNHPQTITFHPLFKFHFHNMVSSSLLATSSRRLHPLAQSSAFRTLGFNPPKANWMCKGCGKGRSTSHILTGLYVRNLLMGSRFSKPGLSKAGTSYLSIVKGSIPVNAPMCICKTRLNTTKTSTINLDSFLEGVGSLSREQTM